MCEDTTRQGSSGASGGHHPGPHALRPSHADAAMAPNRLSLFVRSYRTALSSPWLKIILANLYEVWSQLPCYWADFDAREKGRGKGSLFSSGVIGKRVPKKRDSLTACTRGPGKVRGTPRWEEACAEERGNRRVGSLPMRFCLKCRALFTTLFRLPLYFRPRTEYRYHRKMLLSATKCGIVYQRRKYLLTN